MLLGPVLDRLTFWNMPSFVKTYELPVPHTSIHHQGIEIWYIPGREKGPTVVFCHGNAGNLRFPKVRRDRFLAIHQTGANLWAFDYRGYGYSQGTPSEKACYEDAAAVHQMARQAHHPGSPFILFGRSLGGAVATYLATEVQCPDLLILESTFTSAPAVVASWSHPSIAGFMNNRFDSLKRFSDLQCPLRMIHGTKDFIVPYKLGRRLYQSCGREKEFVSVVGAGHNNLQAWSKGLYEETLYRWLSL